MGYDVYYKGYADGFDNHGWSCNSSQYSTNSNVEKTSCAMGVCHRRRRRYECIDKYSDKIGWKSGGGGGNPCNTSEFGAQRTVLGGNSDFAGRDENFTGAFAGYKCGRTTVNGTLLKGWSKDDTMKGANATDNSGTSKNFYEQLVFGIKTSDGETTGFCADAKNLSTVVHNDGRTCYGMLQGAGDKALADSKTQLYCETTTGRKDEKCKCYNVTGSGFLEKCRANPTWAGCKEIMPRITELEYLLKDSNLTVDDIGNADCIVPDICGGSVYVPNAGKPVCEIKMEVCNQIMNQKDVKAYGDLESIQSCEFTGENSLDKLQERNDAAREEARDKMREKREAEEAKKRKVITDADDARRSKKRDYTDSRKQRVRDALLAKRKKAAAAAAAAAAAGSTSPDPGSTSPDPGSTSSDSLEGVPTPYESPDVGGGLDKPGGMGQNAKIGVGVGVSVLLCLCLLIVFVMMSSGGRSRR
tara:strand:- start:1795 stop:3207 length:1413 start_codon:yes stop_codon:yes gene_type:complete